MECNISLKLRQFACPNLIRFRAPETAGGTAINGDIYIGTLAPGSAGAPLNRIIEAGAVTANIFIENYRGDLDFVSLVGDITTGTGPGERTPGSLVTPARIYFPIFLSRANGGDPPNVHVHGPVLRGTETGAPGIRSSVLARMRQTQAVKSRKPSTHDVT